MIIFPKLFYRFLIVAFASMLLASCSYTCEDYHIGKFKYEDEDFDAIVTRNETQQIETSESLDYVDIYNVYWTSECSYKLVLDSTNNPSRMPLSKYDTIFVNITDVDRDGYSFKAAILERRPEGRLIKIEQ